MAALCAVIAIAAIGLSRDRWRRVPAVQDKNEAAAGAATGGANRSGRECQQPEWCGDTRSRAFFVLTFTISWILWHTRFRAAAPAGNCSF